MSAAPFLSAPAAVSDEPGQIHAIWDTIVNIADHEAVLHFSKRSRSGVTRDVPPSNAPDRSDEPHLDMMNLLVPTLHVQLYDRNASAPLSFGGLQFFEFVTFSASSVSSECYTIEDVRLRLTR